MTRRAAHKKESLDVHEEIDALKDAVSSLAHKVKKSSQQCGHDVLDQAMEHPAKTLGIAFGVGLLIGLFIKK